MEYIVVSFRQRFNAVKFSELLNGFNIGNQVINTPKEAGVGCGLSVKIERRDFMTARRIIESYNISGVNVFLVTVRAGKRFVKSI